MINYQLDKWQLNSICFDYHHMDASVSQSALQGIIIGQHYNLPLSDCLRV